MDWLKQAVGIQEPNYGRSALRPVTDQAAEKPWTELSRDDMKWSALNYTCVENQVFYVYTPQGHIAMAQLIYNCLAGIRTTCQFNCKILYPNRATPLWTSDTLENWKFDESKTSFYADNCKIELSEDGTSYTVKSSTSRQAIVDLKFRRTAPGLVVGKDGTSYYGTDPAQPWGSMRHSFWPRCKVEGSIITQAGELTMIGHGTFIHCLQGMRPNLTASSWNFLNFHSSTYSAILMEFTTPPSYGTTTVTIGAIATDGKIIHAGPQEKVQHTASKPDAEVGWNEPTAANFTWGKLEQSSSDGVSASFAGELGQRLDRIDVLAQIPAFLKIIIAQAAGSKPYIYQYSPTLPFKITENGEEKTEEGVAFMEATFITEWS